MKYKKSRSHIHVKIEDKVKFIESNKDKFDIKLLCKTLKVTRSNYYYQIKNPINSYEKVNQELDIKIKRISDDAKKGDGLPKITQALISGEIKVSQKKVAKRD